MELSKLIPCFYTITYLWLYKNVQNLEIVEAYLELCGLPFKPLVTKWRGFLAIYLKQKPKMLRN